MTHIEALELDRVPKHLLVLGGGYVGLEMAQALRRFGSRVTVIERNDALAHREDRDVSEALRELFDDEGIEVLTATPVARVEGRSGESVRLHATHGVIEGSDLLVASGRTPNTDGIGLETAGIERDDRGFIKVDERLRTTAAGVWAVGDCAGSPHFTHIADDDVRVIRDNLAGIDRVTTGRLVSGAINSGSSARGCATAPVRNMQYFYTRSRRGRALTPAGVSPPTPPASGGVVEFPHEVIRSRINIAGAVKWFLLHEPKRRKFGLASQPHIRHEGTAAVSANAASPTRYGNENRDSVASRRVQKKCGLPLGTQRTLRTSSGVTVPVPVTSK